MMKRILALVAIGSLFAFAQTPATTTSEATGLRATATQEEIAAHQTRMQTALDNNDYATWKSEHDAWNPGDTRFEGKVTAENFPKFAEMVKARKAGTWPQPASCAKSSASNPDRAWARGRAKEKARAREWGRATAPVRVREWASARMPVQIAA